MKTHPFLLQKEIPQYGLYGHSSEAEPELVHILDIGSRSPGHDWLIHPHRHNHMYQLVYLERGIAEVFVDENVFVSEGGWVFTLPSGTVHGYQFSGDIKGKIITLSDHFLSVDVVGSGEPIYQELLTVPSIIKMNSDAPFYEPFKRYFTLIESELSTVLSGQKEMLQALSNALILTLYRQSELSKSGTDMGYKTQLVYSFISQLGEHYVEQWGVERYARSLNISCSTLNRLCHEKLGKSAKSVIQNRLLKEIKRKLIYTSESLDEISWSLGFKDTSYFCRIFKKMTGTTLKKYRSQNNIGNKL